MVCDLVLLGDKFVVLVLYLVFAVETVSSKIPYIGSEKQLCTDCKHRLISRYKYADLFFCKSRRCCFSCLSLIFFCAVSPLLHCGTLMGTLLLHEYSRLKTFTGTWWMVRVKTTREFISLSFYLKELWFWFTFLIFIDVVACWDLLLSVYWIWCPVVRPVTAEMQTVCLRSFRIII